MFAKAKPWVKEALLDGLVIPAHPLALTIEGKLDERRQQALTRYYFAAGAGGVAVAVHTTQFELREYGLLKPVLQLAAEVRKYEAPDRVLISGVCGQTRQAVAEAALAAELGYDVALVDLSALREASLDELIVHCLEVARVLPLMGFYLQEAVGGRVLPREFWYRFCEIENVVGIKVAPFNRYQTLDVVRAVVETGRAGDIALYTGNDDHIILDLITPFEICIKNRPVELWIVGGLLGQWSFWTKRAVEIFNQIKHIRNNRVPVPQRLLTLSMQITDVNSAVFDAANRFRGCIPGINEMLRRMGFLKSRRCLKPDLDLSPGQDREIDRVWEEYPHLRDDDFVSEHLAEWLR
ncbi:MAG: dihydrodipicolinate synthase family protein [Candidatus Bathyarchaeia archaeon]